MIASSCIVRMAEKGKERGRKVDKEREKKGIGGVKETVRCVYVER